jgi:hypothetical protein
MRRLGAAVIAACLLSAAACSSDGDSGDSASSTSTSSSTTTPASTTTEALPEEASAADVWVELWAAATTEGSTVADLEAFATSDVAEQILTIVTIDERQRRAVLNTPSLDPAGTGGDATVEDCAFLTPPQAEAAANFFRASGTVDDAGVLRFEDFEVVARTGCIPAALNDAILADYADYWDGLNEVSNPPDPESPRLAEIASGEHLRNLRSLTADDAANGRYYREKPTLHPEVTEWRTSTTIVLLDCQETDPQYGAYDQETDERLATDPPAKPGQRDLREITMAFEDGRWKVIDRQGSTDTSCEFAPTPLGVAVV